MPNNNYKKGYSWEREIINILSKLNYNSIRSGGSKGVWDIISWNAENIRFIQAKFYNKKFSLKKETEKIKKEIVPRGAKKEIWVKQDRKGYIIHEI